MVWEIQPGGSQTNGGGFKPGATGTDWSQQATVKYALTTVTSAGQTAVMTHASAAADMVGNICFVVSGTSATANKWYEIISVNVGVDITVDTNWCTGACNNGVVNVGGAFKIGGNLDNDFFQYGIVAGNTVWIAAGTYTVEENISYAKTGTALLPILINGYHDARGDNPVGDDRLLINTGNYQLILNAYGIFRNLRFTTIYSQGVRLGNYDILFNCKSTNTSTSSYPAFYFGSDSQLIGCEAVSRKGQAFYTSAGGLLVSCYAHDSVTGFYVGSSGLRLINSVLDTCQKGVSFGGSVNYGSIIGNTIRNCLYGISGLTDYGNVVLNNIIADCVIGANWSTATPYNWFDYNCWSNNDTAVSGVSKGANDITADALLTGTVTKGADGATDGAGTSFTAASNPFGGVTTSDFLNIVETGTGATLGVYAISAVVDSGTLTLATSAAANKTGIDYCIMKGTDFTLSAGSPCFNAGLKLGVNVGL